MMPAMTMPTWPREPVPSGGYAPPFMSTKASTASPSAATPQSEAIVHKSLVFVAGLISGALRAT